MGKLRLNRPALASRIRRSPEHVRKLETGRFLTAADLEEKLTEALEMNPEETKQFTEALRLDRWVKEFGPPPKSAIETPIDKYWNGLTSEQQQTLVCLAECLSRPKTHR